MVDRTLEAVLMSNLGGEKGLATVRLCAVVAHHGLQAVLGLSAPSCRTPTLACNAFSIEKFAPMLSVSRGWGVRAGRYSPPLPMGISVPPCSRVSQRF